MYGEQPFMDDTCFNLYERGNLRMNLTVHVDGLLPANIRSGLDWDHKPFEKNTGMATLKELSLRIWVSMMYGFPLAPSPSLKTRAWT